jgi:hypothetical protein
MSSLLSWDSSSENYLIGYCHPQDPKWQVGDLYTPVDAIAQGLKTASLNDTKVLAQTITNWFKRFEE